jgi:SAM-dependent methyltransferase
LTRSTTLDVLVFQPLQPLGVRNIEAAVPYLFCAAAVFFSRLGLPLFDFFTRVKVDHFVQLIQSLRPPAERAQVIDIGCGVANSHPLLAGRVGRLVGVDVSLASLAKAAEQNPNNEYRGYDGLSLPYADATFDVASAICVFHHVPLSDRGGLAKEAHRVLRPGGFFAMFEHNPYNPLTRRAVNNCEFDKDAALLRKQEAEALLERAGFRDVESRFILAVPTIGRLLRAADRLLGRLPFGAQYFTFGRA